jgi:hypothetical protein
MMLRSQTVAACASARRCHIIASGQRGSSIGGSCTAMPTPVACEPPGDTGGERRNEISLGDHEGCDHELWQAQHHAPFEPQRGELMVDQPRAVALGRYEEMQRGREGLKAGTVRKCGVPTPRDARKAFLKQRAHENTCRRFDRKADREVRLAAVEEFDRFAPTEHSTHAHVDARRLDAELRQERWQQDERSIVGHRDRERVIGSRGIEAVGL